MAEVQNVTSVIVARIVGEWGGWDLVCWIAPWIVAGTQLESWKSVEGVRQGVSFCDVGWVKNRV